MNRRDRRGQENRTRRQLTLRARAMPEVGEGVVELVASRYGVAYDIGWGWREQIQPGCFAESIAERNGVFPIFMEHDWTAASLLGNSTSADETAERLRLIAQLYMDDLSVAKVWRAMDAGAINEWSVAFWPQEITWTDDDPDLDLIEKGDLAEVSLCVRGANPETETVSVRGRRYRVVARPPRSRADGDSDSDPAALAVALDAVIDEISEALDGGDVAAAQALITAAETSSDALLEALGETDEDDDPADPPPAEDGAEVDARMLDALSNPRTRQMARDWFSSRLTPSAP